MFCNTSLAVCLQLDSIFAFSISFSTFLSKEWSQESSDKDSLHPFSPRNESTK